MAFLRCLALFALLSITANAATLPDTLSQAAPDANPAVIALAVQAAQCQMAQSEVRAERLAVIDYSRPSTERRLWVFDLPRRTLLFRELVAHGRNSGENLATSFSNTPDSLASSLGLFSTREAYTGKNGYSLRMDGLEPGINDQAFARDVVIHGAAYVSDDFARANGRLGRSHGCPAVPTAVAQPLIDTLKQGQLLFVYYPDAQWLKTSTFLHCPSAASARQP